MQRCSSAGGAAMPLTGHWTARHSYDPTPRARASAPRREGHGFEPGASRSRTVQWGSPAVLGLPRSARNELVNRRRPPRRSPAGPAYPRDSALSLLSAVPPRRHHSLSTREPCGGRGEDPITALPSPARSLAAPADAAVHRARSLGSRVSGRPKVYETFSSAGLSHVSRTCHLSVPLCCRHSCRVVTRRVTTAPVARREVEGPVRTVRTSHETARAPRGRVRRMLGPRWRHSRNRLSG